MVIASPAPKHPRKNLKTGMTLGKFAPFHAGHQRVVETALKEMDRVIVLIYHSPETTRIPLAVRAGWIKTLYPTVEIIEAWDGPSGVGDDPALQKRHEAYILKILGGIRIDAFYSSEFYGEHVSRALNAENRQVDPDRVMTPVSGTRIRQSPFRCRQYLHPLVYRDHVVNAVFMGAPCTGKTTLARLLAEKHQTEWMPEYGREYWEKHNINRRLSPEQLVDIARAHVELEDAKIGHSDTWLFTDTNAITTYMFGKYYHGLVLPELKELAEQAEKRYDLFFLCEDDIPYENTWDRSGEMNRHVFQQQIEADLRIRKRPFIRLRGGLEKRMATVESVLAHFNKFENLSEVLLKGR